MEDLDAAIAETRVRRCFLPVKPLCSIGGRSGVKHGVLSDFFIGAHAAVMGWSVLTRDPRRYRSYFEIAQIIAP